MVALFGMAFSFKSNGQCTNGTAFGTANAPTTPTPITITTCAYAGEYSTVNNAVAGQTYQFTGTGGAGNYLTIRQGTPGGTVLAFGFSPVSATVTVSGPVYVHVNVNAACATDAVCHTLTVGCTSCVPPAPPANDLCANATAIVVPSATTGTTVNATLDNTAFCGTSNTAPGVWYTFTNNVGNGRNRVILNTCTGTTYDSKLTVFTGTCAALSCVAGNDDACGLQSQVAVTTTGANTTYRVLVHGFGSATGPFTLTASQLASITNIALGAQTACDPATNLYTQSLTLTYLNPPTTGTLLVNGQSFPITGSPQTVVLTGLTSNSLPVNVNASFSADPASAVTLPNFFTAPAKCNLCKVNCPADIVKTLGAGDCESFINYNITTSGDCTQAGTVSGFQGAFAPANWTVGLVNSNGGVNTAGAPASITLNGSDNGTGTAGQTNYTIPITFTGTVTFTYNYSTVDAGFFDPFGYTVNGVFTPVVNGFVLTQTGTVSVNVSAGDVFGFSQRTLDNIFGPGNTTITNFSGPASILLTPTQTAGLPSGSPFGIGVTTNTFTIPNGIGGTSTCSFKVTVNEYPNPTTTLVCNNLVQASLDATCSGVIGADMILEGGPYGCYDSRYTVMILSPLGANLGNTINASFIGPQWTVKVTDKVTGNSCWGKIKVEDKIAPVIVCRDQIIACTEDPVLAPAPAIVGPQPIIYEGLNNPIGEPGAPIPDIQEYSFDYSYFPAGTPVLDVNARIKLTGHTWLPDLNMVVTSPDGTTADVFSLTGCFGSEWPIDVTWDDEGAGGLTQCAALNAGGAPTQCLILPGVQSNTVLSVFDGKNASGTWKFTISDNVGGDDGVVEIVGLIVTVDLPAVPAMDNCSGEATLANGRLTYMDSNTPGACGGPSKTTIRTWTAKDNYGNSSSCTQKITYQRPAITNVDAPKDIKWSCEQYNAYQNITAATALHPYLADCDAVTASQLEMTCYNHTCNDNALNGSVNVDNPAINNTKQGACTSSPTATPGLENADVFALTGSGLPTVNGKPLNAICGISYEHEDIVINVCPGSFKILRKWTLIDWCANPVAIRQVNQVIKVVDESAPTITAPADATINVFNASTPPNSGPHAVCKGTVVVPPATGIADNCSGVTGLTTELWTVNAANQPVTIIATIPTNGGLFPNIPLYINGIPAKYLARYYAVDGCGNQAFDDAIYTLRDKVPPVAICDEITEVSVTNNSVGTGGSCSTLFAHNLDDGSYDNCAPVYFLIAKMDDSFSPNIFNRCYYPSRDFCCSDIGNETVIVLVLDSDPAPFFTSINQPALGCDGTPGLLLSATANYPFNYNTCMVTVQVTDKLPPILVSCPPNTRITCDNYANNFETQLQGLTGAQQCAALTAAGFGEPSFYDNCQVDITCNTNINLDQCLEGTITRTWTAKDGAGNSGTQPCNQTIFVDHVSDWVVEFPADITVNCGTNVPNFGEPKIFGETCELVGVSFKDEVFTVVPDACYKILRTWTLINWCVVGTHIDQEVVESSERAFQLAFPTEPCDFDGDGDCDTRTFRDSWRVSPKSKPGAAQATQSTDPDTDPDTDPWDGYITYQQVIKVNDTVDPVFTNGCQIPDVCIVDNSCGGTILLPTPQITDCSQNVTVTAQIKIGGVWLNGFGPYVNVAPGTYEVRYKAIDNCNNQKDCNTTVTVKDCKKPTPYCKNGLVIEIMQTGMIQIWASDFNAGSFDNCTSQSQLKLSFSSNVNNTSKTYTCDDLGQQPVQIWVTDLAGNQDFCETFIIIQDNMGACNDDPQIAGKVATAANQGVQGVSINLNSPGGFGNNTTTNANGAYNVNVPSGNDFTITPVLDVNPLNGVSTFDLVLISKHILGVQLLDSPYKIIAADANRSNSVTTFDLVEIRKLILFINTNFPNNTSWRFVKKSHVFANPANPFATQFPEVINLNNVSVNSLANDFVAVKIGDVNGSAAVNLTDNPDDRTMVGDLVLNADDVTVEAGNTYTVNFKATDFNVSGYQFTLNFDKQALELVEVVPGLADVSNFGMTMAKEGVLTTSWNADEAKQLAKDEVVFGLTFKALRSGRMSNLININSRYTVAEAYNANAELMNVAMSFNNQLAAGGFELYQNTPNPFATETNIGFYLPEATSAKLTISDVQGKVVKVIKVDAVKGYNQVSLKRGELGATGVMYYRLDTDTDSATRKMILVD